MKTKEPKRRFTIKTSWPGDKKFSHYATVEVSGDSPRMRAENIAIALEEVFKRPFKVSRLVR